MKTIKTLALVAVFAVIGSSVQAADWWNSSYNSGRYDTCNTASRYHPVYNNCFDRNESWRHDAGTAYRFHDYDYGHRNYFAAPRYGYNEHNRW